LVKSEETPVVGGQFGDWYRPSHFTSEFAAFRQQHKFDIRLHDLRHTQASLLLKSGESIVTVSKRLGHAKVSTTLDTYSHIMPGQDKGAAEKIGDIFMAKVI
jgi:integrase